MRIVVLIKQTPDTTELPKISADAVRTGAITATMVINPWDEFAAEEAIQLCERFGGETLAMTLGSPDSTDALKHALAMGVGGATLIDNSGVNGGDMWSTAGLLAAAVGQQGDVDLVLTGAQSVDENSGAVFVGVATKLGCPLLSNVSKILDIADGVLTVERVVDGSQETVRVTLPAVVSVSKEINDPRYPSFMGIRKANRAKIPAVSAADLGIEFAEAKVQWSNIRKPEQRATKVTIIDGDSVADKAAKLVDALMAEKVI